ncbi:HD domain-containing protein [bacterium]|nr:HD domain-containing protein [bacterium]MBU1065182.1 HD domain-containing protein [bacterium]MBU1635166.1 HD domain-containing protein [bacterium]MBU1872697.1 HD domain-containing protein [bacterium]
MEPKTFSPAAKDIYKQALRYVILKEREVRETGEITVAQLFELANLIVESTEKSEQLNSFAVYYFDTADITHSHVINTAIFATVLVRGIGYSEDDLVKVCATALLHDIGVAKVDSAIFNKPIKQLKPHEINAIKNHSGFGYEIIVQSDDKLEGLAQSVFQHHEKGDGSGYPGQLTEKEMLPTAQILSLIDVYESLIHPRDHRDALIPPLGIQELIKQEGKRFSKPLLKALIETISLYPTGCYVKLNSGELARVIKTNKHLPTRPQVKILFDARRQSTKQQILDLARNNLAFIQTCIPPPGMRKIE